MKDFVIGAGYILLGFRYLLHPKLRLFVIWPILINIAIFSIAFYLGYDYITTKLASYQVAELPWWLSWLQGIYDWIFSGLKWLVTSLWIFSFVFIFSLFGSLMANLLASPFNGWLCEAMDLHVNQFTPPNRGVLQVILTSIIRELKKWLYYLPRLCLIGIICLILFFIPGVNLFSTVLLYAFGCWMLAFQYLDYPADNRVIDMPGLKKQLESRKLMSLGFGTSVYVFTLIPGINFIILPLATLAATKLWADYYQDSTNKS